MIVIFDYERIYIRESLKESKEIIKRLYGEYLSKEAFHELRHEREGEIFRRNAGPLIKVVGRDEAELIALREENKYNLA